MIDLTFQMQQTYGVWTIQSDHKAIHMPDQDLTLLNNSKAKSKSQKY